MTKLLFYENAFQFEFVAQVVEKHKIEKNKYFIVLNETCFYPTGGGQDCDTGKIGNAKVLEVTKDENGKILHWVDSDIEENIVKCFIDKAERINNMQHHTAQHLLSQTFYKLLKYETTSVKINGKKPSYFDLKIKEVNDSDLKKAEDFANQLVWQNVAVKSYFVSHENISKIPLRRENTKVTGDFRIVEIEGFDYSTCGGTHVQNTNQIGLIKIIKTEKQNNESRIYFVAGNQTSNYFDSLLNTCYQAAKQLNTSPERINEYINQLNSNYQTVQKKYSELKEQFLPLQAQKLYSEAIEKHETHFIIFIEQDKAVADLRILANCILKYPKSVGFFAGIEAKKLSLIVCCTPNSGFKANELLQQILKPINGKGGGNDKMAQGGGEADIDLIKSLLNSIIKEKTI